MVVSCLSENPRLTRPSKLLSISSYRFAQNEFCRNGISLACERNFYFYYFFILFFLFPFSSILSLISFASVPRVSRALENNILDFVVTVDFCRGTRIRDRIRGRKSKVRDARASFFKIFKILGSDYIRCKDYTWSICIYMYTQRENKHTHTHNYTLHMYTTPARCVYALGA